MIKIFTFIVSLSFNNSWKFTLIAHEVQIPSDDQRTIYRDYRCLPGGIGGHLADFDQFQVKIVMKSTNNAKVPKFQDMRIIALSV